MRALDPKPMRVYFHDLMLSPVVANLRWLRLTSLGLTDWFIEALAQTAFATNLDRLRLGDNYISPDGVRIIANTPVFKSLTFFRPPLE